MTLFFFFFDRKGRRMTVHAKRSLTGVLISQSKTIAQLQAVQAKQQRMFAELLRLNAGESQLTLKQ
jgi:uncharacterized protein YhbP (UPF0306 family)